MIRRFLRSAGEILKATKTHVANFIKGAFRHAETTGVLVLASFGANAMLSEVPFYMALPMWVEGTMIIPVASVMVVMGLIKLAEVRARHRGVKVLAA